MQLSVPRNHTLNIIRRAERNGFKAIVLGVDESVTRMYHRHEGGIDLSAAPNPNMIEPTTTYTDSSQSWNDVAWVKSQTSLPVVVKGLLDASQVKDAHDAGVDAIYVSNQAGR